MQATLPGKRPSIWRASQVFPEPLPPAIPMTKAFFSTVAIYSNAGGGLKTIAIGAVVLLAVQRAIRSVIAPIHLFHTDTMSSVIEGQVDNGVLRVELGVIRLDASASRDFKQQVEAVWSPDVTEVEMDFGRVGFIDSSGVGALLGVYKRLPPSDSPVRLTHVQAPVQSVIELLRPHKVFDISN